MKIKVKFFSSHREAVGRSEINMKVDEGMRLKELMDMLMDSYPKLKKLSEYTVLSLNHRYASGEEILKEGDEVAIFPPVEGG
jgi:MoaD family protein